MLKHEFFLLNSSPGFKNADNDELIGKRLGVAWLQRGTSDWYRAVAAQQINLTR